MGVSIPRNVSYRDVSWDLSHLNPFSFQVDLDDSQAVVVVVVFTCHCFTRGATHEEIAGNLIPDEDWYDDGRERRVLDAERYQLSRQFLPSLIEALGRRRIIVADERRGNFVTFELLDASGRKVYYSVYFDVAKERKRRLLLRVQTAYLRNALSAREAHAKPVKLKTLLKAALEGRKIRS